MIQGGDPTGTGSGNGPRTLKSEFTREKKHERGVLSMARTADPNSASCQFFVMHGPAPGLDGQYSIFGKLVSGYETLDKIASAPGTKIDQATVRPTEPQRIEKAIVLRIAK
jgi:peptidyl-prolyl cis-trans isomerase B (cyclophilin B)